MSRNILVLDIGGTNTTLAMMSGEQGKFVLKRKQRLGTPTITNISFPINDFLRLCADRDGLTTDACCISVAGPVEQNKVEKCVNVPFGIDSQQVLKETAVRHLKVINDFLAVSYGILLLDMKDKTQVIEIPHASGTGKPKGQGTIAVIGAGTGLGCGFLTWADGKYTPHASEGGHALFSPQNTLQFRILEHIRKEHFLDKRGIGYQPFVSGQGVQYIYGYLKANPAEAKRLLSEKKMQARKSRQGESAAFSTPEEISRQAGNDPLARITMQLFAEFYGYFAQSAVLFYLATGGVYIAGGVAAKNQEIMFDGTFMRAFEENYAHKTLLQEIPVYLTLDYDISLYGCAECARRTFVLQ